jgi:hypothetical protein
MSVALGPPKPKFKDNSDINVPAVLKTGLNELSIWYVKAICSVRLIFECLDVLKTGSFLGFWFTKERYKNEIDRIQLLI